MAVAIFIIALLLGSILVPLESRVESRNYDQTQRILDQAREALLGYAAAYGYFPCPADYALGSNGAEATAGGGYSHGTGGDCPSSVRGSGGGAGGTYIGYLPAVTLAFTNIDSQGYAVDAWGLSQNRIRYALSRQNVGGVTRPFVSANGMRSAGMSNILSTNLLSVCNSASGASTSACASAATTLTSNAIAVIWSLGSNAATGGTSTDEVRNAQTLANADRVFIKKEKTAGTGPEFDDVVTWISPPMLFNQLIAAGQLP